MRCKHVCMHVEVIIPLYVQGHWQQQTRERRHEAGDWTMGRTGVYGADPGCGWRGTRAVSPGILGAGRSFAAWRGPSLSFHHHHPACAGGGTRSSATAIGITSQFPIHKQQTCLNNDAVSWLPCCASSELTSRHTHFLSGYNTARSWALFVTGSVVPWLDCLALALRPGAGHVLEDTAVPAGKDSCRPDI